jgi:hypothetical protein
MSSKALILKPTLWATSGRWRVTGIRYPNFEQAALWLFNEPVTSCLRRSGGLHRLK